MTNSFLHLGLTVFSYFIVRCLMGLVGIMNKFFSFNIAFITGFSKM